MKTTVGIDAICGQVLGTAAQPAAFNFMAVTASAVAPAAADTTLAGEIATAGGGLIRAQATYAHTAGTATATLTKAFTANGTDTLPVTINKIGVLNATAVGTLGFETALTAGPTLQVSGDSVTVTDTLTVG